MTNIARQTVTHIVIVDRHLWVLHALSQLINSQTDFVVSKLFTDWRAVLTDQTDQTDQFNSCPSIFLLDWELPGIGPQILNNIRFVTTQAKIIAMGIWLTSRRTALAAGVDGFINKTDPPEQVLAVLRRVRTQP
jgi:DNA-binding NarL/FixJ family response regulator